MVIEWALSGPEWTLSGLEWDLSCLEWAFQVWKGPSRACDSHSLVCNGSLTPEFGPVNHENGSCAGLGWSTCVRVGPFQICLESGPSGLKLVLSGLT